MVEKAWDEYVGGQRASLWTIIANRSVIANWVFPQRLGRAYHANTIPAFRIINEPDLRSDYAKAYVDNWNKIRQICNAYSITPFFILQPTSLYSLDYERNQNGILNDEHRANHLVYERFRQETAQFAATNPDLGVLDLSEFLPLVEYFYDGCHVYDEVNDRIANRIADLISPTLFAKIKHASSSGTQ